MQPTKFLGCNPWTLPFPIPAGGQGPAGLQSARSRAGPAGQSPGLCPLDFQRALGCLGKPRGSELCAKGWSGKGLDPKGEVFLRPPGWAAPRIEYVVPCSMESQFPYLWSAPLCSTHWMPIQGNQECTKWAFPAAMATPESTTGEYPHPLLPRPASQSRAGRVCPPLARSWCVPSHSGDNREHNWDPHPRPDTTRPPPLTARGSPRPHAQFQERLSDLFHLLPPDETQGQVNPPHRDNPSCL